MGWLADCSKSERRVLLRHGPRVEVGEVFACEAVWPGRYGAGDLDRQAVVMGSGARLRAGEVVFVSSTSTVDRLHSMERPDGPLVSNSLACLASATGARAHMDYWRYVSDVASIVNGLDRYKREIPTTAGPVRLTYFRNLAWSGEGLEERDKPALAADLGGFGAYRAFLRETMAAAAENMADPGRRHPYRWQGTLSSGYDSPTVTVLGVEAGCREAVTFDRSRRGEPDSGEAVARALGIEPIVIERASWYRKARALDPLPEAAFLAAMPNGELAPFAAAREHFDGRVVLTGFHGGGAWGLSDRAPGRDIPRRDAAGLGFIEFRLLAGAIDCAPAFWTATRADEIAAIGRSEEMRPWIIGDSYQRPIARRIVEEAGVPRAAFGQRKQPGVGASLADERQFLGPESLADYRAWLRSRAATLSSGRLLAIAAAEGAVRAGAPVAAVAAGAARELERALGKPLPKRPGERLDNVESRLRVLAGGAAERIFLFQWGLERSAERYPMPAGAG